MTDNNNYLINILMLSILFFLRLALTHVLRCVRPTRGITPKSTHTGMATVWTFQGVWAFTRQFSQLYCLGGSSPLRHVLLPAQIAMVIGRASSDQVTMVTPLFPGYSNHIGLVLVLVVSNKHLGAHHDDWLFTFLIILKGHSGFIFDAEFSMARRR